MPPANYKTTICRHYELGCCLKTKEECPFAHGHTDLRKHCRFGFTCRWGLDCEYPHHPIEIEYFRLKAQVKPKVVRDMGTQTDFQEYELPAVLPPPPAGFTDDDTGSETSTDGETVVEMDPKEKMRLAKRKSMAKWHIKNGLKKLEDYNQTTWRTIKKAEKKFEGAKQKAYAVRRSFAKREIMAGRRKPEDYDENFYQVKRRTYTLKVID